MPEPKQDFTPKQLLERIIRLETKVTHLTLCADELKTQNLQLKDAIRGLWGALQKEAESTTKHLGTIDEYLWPVVYKMFPKVAEGDREIFEFIEKNSKKQTK